MSFNKRYVTKEIILYTIKNGESLSRLVNADALIMDSWSSNFFDTYSFKKSYNQNRKKLESEVIFSSNLSDTYSHPSFDRLEYLSNIYENLIREDSWTEILLTFKMLGNEGITDEMVGKFYELKKLCIKKLENHFKGESRNKAIDNILNESK